jgi:hypothetical protein
MPLLRRALIRRQPRRCCYAAYAAVSYATRDYFHAASHAATMPFALPPPLMRYYAFAPSNYALRRMRAADADAAIIFRFRHYATWPAIRFAATRRRATLPRCRRDATLTMMRRRLRVMHAAPIFDTPLFSFPP